MTLARFDIPGYTFTGLPDVQPFSPRTAIGYQDLLEATVSYIQRTLVPYVGEFKADQADQINAAVKEIEEAVNTALDAQDARYAQTLAQMIAGANVDLNDGNILAVLKAAGAASAAYLKAPVTGIATPEMFRDHATLAGDGNVYDWAPAINAAFAAGYADIELSSEYYFIRTPIRIPTNRGPRIFTRGGKKAGFLNCYMDDPNRAIIEYVNENRSGSFNYAGLTMENVYLDGHGSNCHGIYIQDSSYPNLSRVGISGFHGAGLLLDNVFDGSFDIEIQGCGRTTGDYTSLTDRSDNSKTTIAGLHITSTAPNNGHCNMLRFTGQIEQGNCSPYVRVQDSGAIGLWFNDIHAETRNPEDFYHFDFLECVNGADIEFKGQYVSPEMRNGFILSGFGAYRFIGGRSLGNVVGNDQNSAGRIEIIGCALKYFRWDSSSGSHLISGSLLEEVDIRYPGGGPFRITDCQISGNFKVTNKASSETGVIVDNCRIGGTAYADENSALCELRNSHVVGDCSWQSQLGVVENTTFDGALSYLGFNSTFRPKIFEQWQTGTPQYGGWRKGDRIWNSNPTPGAPMGWVCVADGTPGTWKAFGTIAN